MDSGYYNIVSRWKNLSQKCPNLVNMQLYTGIVNISTKLHTCRILCVNLIHSSLRHDQSLSHNKSSAFLCQVIIYVSGKFLIVKTIATYVEHSTNMHK